MSTLRRIQKRLTGIGPVPHRVIGLGTGFACLVLLGSALLVHQADTHHARTVATALFDGGVWVFAESIIGGLLMQSYAEKHAKD